MNPAEKADGRAIVLDTVEVEMIRVRVLPDGRMDRENAAKYLGRKSKTLAMWAMERKGPKVYKSGGRCFYFKDELDAFLKGEEA